jgi:tetratricopeptide (TPR) repeat protein
VCERVQLFVLRRAQGRLDELEDELRRSVHEYPTLLRFRFALAHLYAQLGDVPTTRSMVQKFPTDFGVEYQDAEWLFTACLLPDVYRTLGDGAAAARLYELLLPHERLYSQAPIEATFGSVARGLGVLATTMRRFGDAERHFVTAIEIEHSLRARPWVAHAQHDFASMLVEAGDPGRARGLIQEAVAGYRELGMDSWAERAAALRASVS